MFNIAIPYEVAENIYNQSVDARESVTLKENQMLWEPNAYIVQCQGNQKVETFGKSLLTEIDSAYIQTYDYGRDNIQRQYLYHQDGFSTIPKEW